MDDTDQTVPSHVFAAALPYVEIEISQRELSSDEALAGWSDSLAAGLLAVGPDSRWTHGRLAGSQSPRGASRAM